MKIVKYRRPVTGHTVIEVRFTGDYLKRLKNTFSKLFRRSK